MTYHIGTGWRLASGGKNYDYPCGPAQKGRIYKWLIKPDGLYPDGKLVLEVQSATEVPVGHLTFRTVFRGWLQSR